MAKLTPEKIKWIIRHKERGDLSTVQLALIQKVTPRRVNQLWEHYRRTGNLPVLKSSGRPRELISSKQVNTVLSAHEKYKVGACMLEQILKLEYGVKMSHNKIHRVLIEHELAKRDTNKARRRKWVRYERKHSMSLWHTDWKYLKSSKKWLCLS